MTNQSMRSPVQPSRLLLLLLRLLLLSASSRWYCGADRAPSSFGDGGKPFVLRFRRADGSVQRIGFASEEEASCLTLGQVLKEHGNDLMQGQGQGQEQCSIEYGSRNGHKITTHDDDPQTISQLGIRHGTMLTILPRDQGQSPSKGWQQKAKAASAITTDSSTEKEERWDPFPDLAKRNYEGTKRQVQRKKAAKAQLSFGDLSAMHQALHAVEPQPTGPLHRLYLCQTAAERFFQSSFIAADQTATPRCALLLGTFHKERKDLKKTRNRQKTSLSTTTESEQFCQVAKVQAVWEPPQQPSSNLYDASQLLNFVQTEKVINIATWLGLLPVGWMYSYPDKRHDGGNHNKDDALPVFGRDVQIAAKLQIANMKRQGREDGSRFVTVAMHAPTGATEAFQLSQVAVQMVAEDMLVIPDDDSSNNNNNNNNFDKRIVPSKHAILVDGRETQELDSVLCLVNTALLSHERGTYVGSFSGVKKNNPYQLTKKMRKMLSKAVAEALAGSIVEDNPSPLSSSSMSPCRTLLELLANFNCLVALYDDLPKAEMQSLVETVRKWGRGQKKGTTLEPSILKLLRQLFV